MCATKTCMSALPVPAAAFERRDRSAFTAMTMMVIIMGAFREALAMRRAAQKSFFLSDE